MCIAAASACARDNVARYDSKVQSAPKWYVDWRSTIDFDDVEYGVGGIRLLQPNELPDGQVGYAVTEDGESLSGTASGDWKPDWVVIGNETACGDPIFVSDVAPHPVFSAMHGEGSWEARFVAPSLGIFAKCLIAFRTFASGRGNPVQLEANAPSVEQQTEFLKAIKGLTVANLELLDFWAVQIEVDLEALDQSIG